MTTGMEGALERVVGPGVLARIRVALRPRPLILLGGDQLTGKSSTARILAQRMGGVAGSTGTLVRRRAELDGCTLQAMNQHLAAYPDVDVQLDFEAAMALARGSWPVYECRMAGHLGLLLRRAGHPAVRSIRLTCGAREQALRQVERSLGRAGRAAIEPRWPAEDGRSPEAWIGLAVELLGSRAGASLDPDLIASRDARDRDRLMRLYGVDYTDPAAYDVHLATEGMSPERVAAEILSKHAPVTPPGTCTRRRTRE